MYFNYWVYTVERVVRASLQYLQGTKTGNLSQVQTHLGTFGPMRVKGESVEKPLMSTVGYGGGCVMLWVFQPNEWTHIKAQIEWMLKFQLSALQKSNKKGTHCKPSRTHNFPPKFPLEVQLRTRIWFQERASSSDWKLLPRYAPSLPSSIPLYCLWHMEQPEGKWRGRSGVLLPNSGSGPQYGRKASLMVGNFSSRWCDG